VVCSELLLFDDGQRAEEVAGGDALVRVPQELGVHILISGQREVTVYAYLAESFVQWFNSRDGHSVDAVVSELIQTNGTITVHVDCSELSLDEELECLGEIAVGLALAGSLHSSHELLGVHLSVLVEVSDLGNLVPEVAHPALVLRILVWAPGSLALHQGVLHGQALEVRLVQHPVVVNVVHVSDDKLDSVGPGVCHFKLGAGGYV